jgi:hypothetical protein
MHSLWSYPSPHALAALPVFATTLSVEGHPGHRAVYGGSTTDINARAVTDKLGANLKPHYTRALPSSGCRSSPTR